MGSTKILVDICVYKMVYNIRWNEMEFDGFDWDSGNRDKCQKHGVSLAEIEGLFRGLLLVGPDAGHSFGERRFRAVGLTAKGRNLFVVFTWRQREGKRLIRPVSARYMHKKEVQAHEEEIPRIQD
jgi:uncharacterized DUF497 family protein